ncbi:MF14B protein, partial [Polypterus senegalus]
MAVTATDDQLQVSNLPTADAAVQTASAARSLNMQGLVGSGLLSALGPSALRSKPAAVSCRSAWTQTGLDLSFAVLRPRPPARQEKKEEPAGVVQGMITGIRGLCNGLGPALYGFIFFLFHVELNEIVPDQHTDKTTAMLDPSDESSIIPGPPFLFGACAVLLAFLVALFIPEHNHVTVKTCNARRHSGSVVTSQSNNPLPGSDEDIEPLLQDSSV